MQCLAVSRSETLLKVTLKTCMQSFGEKKISEKVKGMSTNGIQALIAMNHF